MATFDNEQQVITALIRTVLRELDIEPVQLLLFGSRARGDARTDSDWDFLLVTRDCLDQQQKKTLWRTLSRRLAVIGYSADLLVKSLAQYEKDRLDKGKVAYYAVREGVPV